MNAAHTPPACLWAPAELQEISDVVCKQQFIWVQQEVHKYVICEWRWDRIFPEVQRTKIFDALGPNKLLVYSLWTKVDHFETADFSSIDGQQSSSCVHVCVCVFISCCHYTHTWVCCTKSAKCWSLVHNWIILRRSWISWSERSETQMFMQQMEVKSGEVVEWSSRTVKSFNKYFRCLHKPTVEKSDRWAQGGRTWQHVCKRTVLRSSKRSSLMALTFHWAKVSGPWVSELQRSQQSERNPGQLRWRTRELIYNIMSYEGLVLHYRCTRAVPRLQFYIKRSSRPTVKTF